MTDTVQDLTAREARPLFRAIAERIGPDSSVYASLEVSRYRDEGSLCASVYPKGIGNGGLAFSCYAETWRELVDAVNAKWAEFSDEHTRRLIQDMALEIIRITAEMGQCTDAALRAGKFSPGDVARYSAQAAEKANEMAAGGPFSVVTVGGNGEHIEEAA